MYEKNETLLENITGRENTGREDNIDLPFSKFKIFRFIYSEQIF